MRTLAATPALLLCACTAGEAGPSAVATVDTLANGAIRVSSQPEGAWALTGAEPWRVAEDLRIGALEGEDPYLFGSARNVIPDAMGRIWVLDSQAYELRLFDAEGRLVRTVGGQGDGPGEFGSNPCAFPGPDGEIWVESGGRWQRFDTAGTPIGRQPVTRNLGCGVQQWLPDGRFLAAGVGRDPETDERTSYYLDHDMDDSGELAIRDTIPPPDIPELPRLRWESDAGNYTITGLVPLSHRPNGFVGPHGDFWVTDGGGAYRIRRQSLTGDTLLILERPYEPVPVPDSIRAREIEGLDREGFSLEGGFDPDDVPRVYPPFDHYYIATDGTLWVRRQLEGGAYGLDVFAGDGRFLGPVDPPPGFDRMIIHRITAEHMYGTIRDELDVPYVVRLPIERPGR